MNPKLANRIYNYKFGQAGNYIKKERKEVKELIGALSRVIGDIGWISSKEDLEDWICWEDVDFDDLVIILKHAVLNIGYENSKESLGVF